MDELPPLKRRDGFKNLVSRADNVGQNYCCPKEKKAFDHCNWVGTGDCAQNTCARGEVTLTTDDYGDSDSSCNCEYPWLQSSEPRLTFRVGFRSKALCCSPNEDALNDFICNADLCDGNEECEDPDLDEEGDPLKKRSSNTHALSKRATGAPKRRVIELAKYAVGAGKTALELYSAPYPSGFGKLFEGGGVQTLSLKGGYTMNSAICKNLEVGVKFVGNIPKTTMSYTGADIWWNTEHWREVRVQLPLEKLCG